MVRIALRLMEQMPPGSMVRCLMTDLRRVPNSNRMTGSCSPRAILLTLFLAAGTVGWSQPSGGAITMWGYPFVEQDFVWVLDQSCSMGWGSPLPLQVMKAEVTAAVAQLQPGQRFSVIAFSDSYASFAAVPVDATQANRDAAIAWINGLQPMGGTCLAPAVIAALASLASVPGNDKAVLVCCDGAPNCPGGATELANIAAANTSGVAIHAFLLGSSSSAATFMQTLAQQNGGIFVDTSLPVPPFYRRGDATDDGSVNLVDVIFVLEYLFSQGPLAGCPDAADADASGSLSLTDPIYLLTYLFQQGPTPPPPGPQHCGPWVPGSLGPCVQLSCP